ncbi:TIGR00266 family protein [Crossiella cryophila]
MLILTSRISIRRAARGLFVPNSDLVQVRTRHTPYFGVARLLLAPGEVVLAEPGRMVATSYGMAIDARAQGGFLKSLTRAALGTEGPAVALYTAPAQGGWVDLAPSLPGDLHVLELDGKTGWCLSRTAWLAAPATVQFDPEWPGLQALFGGEGGFLTHVLGQGPLVLAACGALDVVTLKAGELVTMDPGHVLAYADTVQVRLRAATHNGSQSIRTGEGLVFDFAGPGEVLAQSRDPRGLASWLRAAATVSRG